MKTDKKRIILQVEGMSCTNCAKGIKKHLESKGIEGVNVNFSTGETSYNPNNKYTEKQVENIIKKLGYSIVLQQKEGLSVVEKYFYFTLAKLICITNKISQTINDFYRFRNFFCV